MSQKTTLTFERIKQDIIYSITHPLDEKKNDYIKGEVFVLIGLFGVIIICAFIRSMWPMFACLIALLVYGITEAIVLSIRRHRKVKKIHMDGYEIATETLSHTEKEQYYISGGKYHRGKTVINYTLHFENDKPWRIPKRICVWSKERMLSDWYVYTNAHRGDTFIIVTKKETGEIVMAYPQAWVSADQIL